MWSPRVGTMWDTLANVGSYKEVNVCFFLTSVLSILMKQTTSIYTFLRRRRTKLHHNRTTMWVNAMILEYVKCIWWALPQSKVRYFFIIHALVLIFGKLGRVILWTVFTWHTVHPNTICYNTIHNSIVTKHTDNVHYSYWR